MDSFFSAEIFSQNFVAVNQDFRSRSFNFTTSPHLSTFSCWQMSFKTLVPVLPRTQCYGSQKWRWSIQWKISHHRAQFRVTLISRLEMLDARIASALNKIIQNSYKKKVSLQEQAAQKEYRFFCGRQIVFMINDFLRLAGAHDTVLDYADLFTI